MRRIVAMLFVLLLAAGLNVSAIDALPGFGWVTGYVVEYFDGEERVRIQNDWETEDGELVYSYVDFSWDANTFFMGDVPEPGDRVTGFFDNSLPAAMIYPPNYLTVAMVNPAQDLPRIIIARFDEDWISGDGLHRLSIGEETEIVFQGGDAFDGELDELIGRKLLVEFVISHRDIPETIPNPEKVTILYERAEHPILEIDWDEFELDWDETEFDPDFDSDFDSDDDFDFYDGVTVIDLDDFDFGDSISYLPEDIALTYEELQRFVPLRAVLEMLGNLPQWNEVTRSVTVGSRYGSVELTIGSEEYVLHFWMALEQFDSPAMSEVFTMAAPEIRDNRTWVPLQFFRDFFGEHMPQIQNFLNDGSV